MLNFGIPILLAKSPPWTLFLYGALIIAIAILGYVGLRWMRRWLYRDTSEPAMTIERAEQMLEAGMISEAEFQAMRKVILGLPMQEKAAGSSRQDGLPDDLKEEESTPDVPTDGASEE